jgi:hypothetical protein
MAQVVFRPPTLPGSIAFYSQHGLINPPAVGAHSLCRFICAAVFKHSLDDFALAICSAVVEQFWVNHDP